MTAPVPDGFPRPRVPRKREKIDDPVRRGRANKRYGQAAQATIRRWLEAETGTQARFHGRKANEETWSHLPVRVECKAGMQCGPMERAYMRQELQSEQSKAFGDIRPFIATSSPEGWGSDFLITLRSSKFGEIANALGYFKA